MNEPSNQLIAITYESVRILCIVGKGLSDLTGLMGVINNLHKVYGPGCYKTSTFY